MYYGLDHCTVCSILVLHFVYGKLQEDNLRYICFAGWKIRIDTSGSRRTRLAFWFSKWTISLMEGKDKISQTDLELHNDGGKHHGQRLEVKSIMK